MKWKKENNLKKLTGPNGDLNKSRGDDSESDSAPSPAKVTAPGVGHTTATGASGGKHPVGVVGGTGSAATGAQRSNASVTSQAQQNTSNNRVLPQQPQQQQPQTMTSHHMTSNQSRDNYSIAAMTSSSHSQYAHHLPQTHAPTLPHPHLMALMTPKIEGQS